MIPIRASFLPFSIRASFLPICEVLSRTKLRAVSFRMAFIRLVDEGGKSRSMMKDTGPALLGYRLVFTGIAQVFFPGSPFNAD